VLGLDTITNIREEFPYIFLRSEEVGAFIFWELDFFDAQMIKSLDSFNFLIVPNKKMKKILKKLFLGKIFVIPTKLSKEKIEDPIHIDKKLYDFEYFLSIFDFNSDIDRKNIFETIECFHTYKKISASQNKLVIKSINGRSHLDQKMEIQQYIKNDPDIIFIDDSWTEIEMRMLLKNCKALISIHRAEGFGLNIFNALESGIPCIATKYGGNVEYMKGYPLLVDYKLIKIDNINFNDSSYLKKTLNENDDTTIAKWAAPDKGKVVEFMIQICKDKDFYNQCVNAGYLSLESYRKTSEKNIDELMQYIKDVTVEDKSLTKLNKIQNYFL
jgi:glycosyltransferase involved in cell wall biosynthesis